MSGDHDEDVPVEYTDSGERPDLTENAERLGVQKDPHGGVEQWAERNVEDPDLGSVSHVDPDHRTDQVAAAEPGPRSRTDDNLVQLPMGATFGMGQEPSAQEREDLVRYAAEVDAELRAHMKDGTPEDGGAQGGT